MANITLNIRATEPNFCIGPQTGTYCTIDTSFLIPVLRVKNTDGDLIRDYQLSPPDVISTPAGVYPYNNVLGLKYIGPKDLSGFYTGAIFFTFERTTVGSYTYYDSDLGSNQPKTYSDRFIIRRWEIDNSTFTLNFKELWPITSNSTDYFDCYDFVLENYVTSLSSSTGKGTGFIEMTTTSGLSKYTTLLIGPSTDTDNPGASEYVYVHSVDGNIVYIRTYDNTIPTKYEYVIGDPVTRLGDFYVFSDPEPVLVDGFRTGYKEDLGYMYKLDFSNYGAVLSKDSAGAYKGVYGAAWDASYSLPFIARWNNLLAINTDNNQVFKIQTLYNIKDYTTFTTAYAVETKGNDILLLKDGAYVVDDFGVRSYAVYGSYNVAFDSFSPYTFNVDVSVDDLFIFRNDVTTVRIHVRDQFGVGLLGKNVYVYDTGGDPDSTLDPPTGYVVTDANGYCFVTYRSGFNYTGESTISVRADGGNTVHGSPYVWGYCQITTYHQLYEDHNLIEQHVREDTVYKSWIIGLPVLETETHTWERGACCFPIPLEGVCADPIISPGNHNLTQVASIVSILDFPTNGSGKKQFLDYLPGVLCMYNKGNVTTTEPYTPQTYLPCYVPADTKWLLDQMVCSRHQTGLNTASTTVDQYVFVQDARPAFYSKKNVVDTDFWIRLRPFSFSLNAATLSIKLRERNPGIGYDSGWYEIVPYGNISTFDAGGGVLGLDFLYLPPDVFKNNSMVFVEVSVYDFAGIPNLLSIEYWFELIADYRRPFIFDMVPDTEEVNVAVDTNVTFKLRDIGAGINIDAVEVYVNNAVVPFEYEPLDSNTYQITYNPINNFRFGDTITVYVVAEDLSENKNIGVGGWTFYTASSTGPWFDFESFWPIPCKRGISRRDTYVEFRVYAIDGNGIDISSLNVQVGGKDRQVTVVPIVYRLS